MEKEKLTNEEINRYIHEAILEQKWWNPLICTECKLPAEMHFDPAIQFVAPPEMPDYCSDASPRALLNEPIRVVTMAVGWDAIELALNAQAEKHIVRPFAEVSLANLMNLSALEISTALVEAHKQ